MTTIKKLLRKEVLHKRRLLAPSVFSQRNQRVHERVQRLLLQLEAKCLHVFLPIARNKEPDTWPIIKTLRSYDMQIIISKTDFETETMCHFDFAEDITFEEGSFGIPEPVGQQEVDPSRSDAILIPLLAADKKGWRIGYGKGYYDRLLTELNPGIVKIGLSLSSLFDEFSFMESHDIALDYCITPFETIECR
ncbi:MAG: 5-formyltetrahydrofolate cyclo-ligase [Cyclobacteriaceae bacterium]|nr:5-formyltetrahydrofolate cyclo-ligase [Cyclobacteriaceae bacterium HetDA_MAG_MS6]